MGRLTSRRLSAARGILALLLPVPFILFLAFFIGSAGTGWKILSLAEAADLAPLRWPRLLAAAAAGGLLSLTGAVLQRMTGNAMASPEVVGVSGGAGLGFAAALTLAPAGGTFALFTGAGIGALVSMAAVLVFASRRDLPQEKLLLAGIAVGSFSSSILSVLLAIGDQRSWQILSWLGGTASTAYTGDRSVPDGSFDCHVRYQPSVQPLADDPAVRPFGSARARSAYSCEPARHAGRLRCCDGRRLLARRAAELRRLDRPAYRPPRRFRDGFPAYGGSLRAGCCIDGLCRFRRPHHDISV